MSQPSVRANVGTTATILMRVVGVDQSLVNQASINSIARSQFLRSTFPPNTTLESGVSVDKATAVFDTPQANEGWADSANGYNFRDRIVCSTVGTIKVEYLIVDSSNRPIVETVEIEVLSVA